MQDILPFLKNGAVRRSVTRFVKESPLLRYVRLLQPETRLWGREPGTLPSFLIIGAQRSGSTFLHDTLAAHTSAYPSPLQKEVHYFDNKYYKSLGWYAKFFESLDDQEDSARTFETSPGYLYHPAAPARITQSLPRVKVAAVLRNPVERALSQYRWMRHLRLEPRGAVEAFRFDAQRLDRERDPEHLRRFDDPLYFDFNHFQRGYLRRSLYHLQLQRWLQHLPPSRIRIVGSSYLFEYPHEVVQKLASFLGLRYHEGRGESSVNQNASRNEIEVPRDAHQIAKKHLKTVPAKVADLVTDEMVFGEGLRLQET